MTVKAQRRGRASNIAVGTGRVVRRGHVNTAHNDVTQTEVDAVAGDVDDVAADLAALTIVVAGILPIDLATADVTGDLPFANIAQIATARILGRNTAGNGDIEVLTTLPNAVQDLITRLGTVTSGNFANTALQLLDTGADHALTLKVNENLSAARVLNILMSNADRTVNLGAASAFTPTWAASGVAPALGDGTLTGIERKIGKLTFINITLTIGATTTVGTGLWTFGGFTDTLANLYESGICQSYDVSTTTRTAGWLIPITTTTVAVGNIAAGGGWQSNNPIAVPAVGDVFAINIVLIDVA